MDKKDFILETTVNLRDIKYSENILSKAYYVHLLFYLFIDISRFIISENCR